MEKQTTLVTRGTFLEAFKEVWTERMEEDQAGLLAAYAKRPAWTNYMLGRRREDGDGSFLKAVMEKLERSLKYKREWYTVDSLFVSGETLHLPSGHDHYFSSRLDVLVEHEHGGSIEEEMWKLIFWRAPLKVLIAYDYWESKKEGKEKKRRWLADKMERLQAMLVSANRAFPENGNTEYLFLVANREKEDEDPRWRWNCAHGPDWQLTELKALC